MPLLKGVSLGNGRYPRKEKKSMAKKTPPVGYREVFTPYIRKNGKVIYPKKAKVFSLLRQKVAKAL
jgi:hypothetical protein